MSQTKAQLIDAVDGSIVTADLADDAVTAAKLASNAVVNASVDASAAIAGTKISPDFGSQAITTTSDSVTIGDSIIHSGDTNCKIRFPTADTVSIETAGSERFRVTSGGNLLIGTDSSRNTRLGTNNFAGIFQIESDSEAAATIARFNNGAGSSRLVLQKGRGTMSSPSVVQSGDDCGQILFSAWDGDTFTNAAQILAEVDGTPGDDDMPGRLVFSTTADGATTSTERMRITSTGLVGIGTTSPSGSLHIDAASGVDGPVFESGGTGNTSHAFIVRDSAATQILRVNNNGNIGMGTTSPDVRLDVSRLGNAWTGQDPIAGTVAHLHNGNNGSSSAVYLGLGGGNASFSGINFGDGDDADVGRITYGHSDNSLSFNVNASERMRISSAGNVGIGLSSPSAKLHVFGTSGTYPTTQIAHSSADTLGEFLRIGRTDVTGIRYHSMKAKHSGAAISNTISFHLHDGSGDPFTGQQEVLTLKGNGQVVVQSDLLLEGSTPSISLYDTDASNRFAFIDGNGGNMILHADKANNGSGSTVKIAVDNSVKVTFDDNGNLLVANSGTLGIGDGGAILAGSNGINKVARNASTGAAVFWVLGGSGQAYFLGDGDLVNTNDSYGGISDQELKENIVDANSQWNDIKALKVRNYNFKESTGYNTHKQIGVVAQELEASGMNGLVKDVEDELYVEGDELPEGKNIGDVKEKGYKSVKYSVLYMKAIKALQESMAKIETLETKVAALEAA